MMVKNTVSDAVDFMIKHTTPDKLDFIAKSFKILNKRRIINWEKILSHPDGLAATIDFVSGTDGRLAYGKILNNYNHPLIREAIEIAGLHKMFSLPMKLRPHESRERKKARAALKRRKLI